jgi:hypothetical protein
MQQQVAFHPVVDGRVTKAQSLSTACGPNPTFSRSSTLAIEMAGMRQSVGVQPGVVKEAHSAFAVDQVHGLSTPSTV